MVIKTIPLKLNNPTAIKREILDTAITRYNQAFHFLLNETAPDLLPKIDQLRAKGKVNAQLITNMIDKDLLRQCNRFCVEPFKDSLKLDLVITLISYSALREVHPTTRFPVYNFEKPITDNLIREAINTYDNGQFSKHDLSQEIARILNRSGKEKPIFFGRYSKWRDYCLLYDEKSRRYYAKLYLMNVKDKNRRVYGHDGRTLRYVAPGEEYVESSPHANRFIILPLSFGKWQKQYLEMARYDPSILKTARLSKKDGEYYLNLSLEIKAEEIIKPQNFLGISRSIKSSLHYTVCDQSATMLHKNFIFCDDQKPEYLFLLSQKIVALSKKHKAQVVMASLSQKTDHLSLIGLTGLPPLSIGKYNQLCSILSYKLPEAGLPAPIFVSANGLFYTCPICGQNCKKNRLTGMLFICTRCGKSIPIEELGSFNLANRINVYQKDKIPFESAIKDGVPTILNVPLGISYTFDETGVDGFYAYLSTIIADPSIILNDSLSIYKRKKRFSILKKLSEAENLSDVIEFRVK